MDNVKLVEVCQDLMFDALGTDKEKSDDAMAQLTLLISDPMHFKIVTTMKPCPNS